MRQKKATKAAKEERKEVFHCGTGLYKNTSNSSTWTVSIVEEVDK